MAGGLAGDNRGGFLMFIVGMIVGLGIFLFGMMQLERSIEALGSDWIKRSLSRSTGHAISSVLSGTAITALVQSSSLVSIIVLAFASAAILPLYNAVGVLLGANLGTTFTGWVVATLGFKADLEGIAVPLIGVGGLIQVLGEPKPRLAAVGKLLFSFGLLLFGLETMKSSVASLADNIDISRLRDFGPVSFLLLGCALAALIQSSSATMMIALTALSTGIIELQGAAALIIGADIGTTSTTILGSLKGYAIKRQLALAHVVFNLVVNLLAFLVLLPALPALLSLLGISDPLYGLVAFHSSFNVIGLLIFIPILKPYSRWISGFFVHSQPSLTGLQEVPTAVPEAALAACEVQVRELLLSGLALNLHNLNVDPEQLALPQAQLAILQSLNSGSSSFEQHYTAIKQREGELLAYAANLQQQPLTNKQAVDLLRLVDCARDLVYAVKTIKDIRPNLIEIRHHNTPAVVRLAADYQRDMTGFYAQLAQLLVAQKSHSHDLPQRLDELQATNEKLHQAHHNSTLKSSAELSNHPRLLSTIFNINRELWHSGNNFIQALEHWSSDSDIARSQPPLASKPN